MPDGERQKENRLLRALHDRGAVALGLGITLGWLALGAWADRYVSHGWSATWFSQVEGERVEIARTTEHRIHFPNAYRALSRYVQGWPTPRLELPRELPAIDAELLARTDVGSEARFLEVRSDNEIDVFVDGVQVEGPTHLSPGEHRVKVVWRATDRRDARSGRSTRPVNLSVWTGSSEYELERASSAELRPQRDDHLAIRYWLWLAIVVGAAIWLGLAYRLASSRDMTQRFKRLDIIVAIVIVGIGFGYRVFDYDVTPEFRENHDELFATWNGWSLLSDGSTRGWSLWGNTYPPEYAQLHSEHFYGQTVVSITPYFEHPPLMHALVGAAAHLGGAQHWLHAKLAHTRWVPIALNTFSIALVFALTRRLFPHGWAPAFAALLFAVTPTIVLQGRVIKEEGLLVPMCLSALLLFLQWRTTRKWRPLIGAAVLMGLTTLVKVPAVVWVVALTMLVAAEARAWKPAWVTLAVGLLAAASWPLFGAVIDWDAYAFAQAHQGTRPTHWNLFPRFVDVAMINHNIVGRGWLHFLWIASGATLLRGSRRAFALLTVPFVAYLCAIAIGSGNWTFGWYLMPLYPFLCIGAGVFLDDLWKRPNLIGGTLLVVLLVFYCLNFTLDIEVAKAATQWPSIRRTVTLTLVALVAPFGAVQVWRHRRAFRIAARFATATALALFVALSGHFVVHYDRIVEEYRNFDRDGYFHR